MSVKSQILYHEYGWITNHFLTHFGGYVYYTKVLPIYQQRVHKGIEAENEKDSYEIKQKKKNAILSLFHCWSFYLCCRSNMNSLVITFDESNERLYKVFIQESKTSKG